MADFTKYINSDMNTSPFSTIVFGSGVPLLEVELNEMQEIEFNRFRTLCKNFIGDGMDSEYSLQYGGDSLLLRGHFIVDGYLIKCNDIEVTGLTEGNIYLSVSVVDITKDSIIKENGYKNGSIIDNTIQDSRMSMETTRRKAISYEITQVMPVDTSYVLLGSLSSSLVFTRSIKVINVTNIFESIPTSLPANGGNADTLDGLHSSSFLKDLGLIKNDSGINIDIFNDYSYVGYLNGYTLSSVPNTNGVIRHYKTDGEPYVYQTFTKLIDKTTYERTKYNNVWSEWVNVKDDGNAYTLGGATRFDYLQHYRFGDGLNLNDANYKQPYSADISDGSTIGLPVAGWYHLIFYPHSNSNGHGLQIAYPLLTNAMHPMYRIAIGTTWQPWRPQNDNVFVQSASPSSPQTGDIWIW